MEASRVASVGGVDRLELAILDHSLKNTGIQQLGLLDDAPHHLAAGFLRLRLDKTHNCDVALDLNVLSQVQPIRGRAKRLHANLWDLGWLEAGLVASDAVRVSQVDVHRGVYVSLQAPRHVMEAAVELDNRGPHLPEARDDLEALRDLIPGRVVLVGLGVARCRDGLVVDNERV